MNNIRNAEVIHRKRQALAAETPKKVSTWGEVTFLFSADSPFFSSSSKRQGVQMAKPAGVYSRVEVCAESACAATLPLCFLSLPASKLQPINIVTDMIRKPRQHKNVDGLALCRLLVLWDRIKEECSQGSHQSCFPLPPSAAKPCFPRSGKATEPAPLVADAAFILYV